jgi:hypothetical protein
MASPVDNIDSEDVLMSISTNLVTPAYSEIVCLISGGLSGSREVTTQTTRCGTAKSGGSPNYTITGSLAVNSAPGGSEISADDLIALFDSGDSFLFKLAHATTPADYYRQGTGFFSSYNETASEKGMVTADFTIEVEGSLDLVP